VATWLAKDPIPRYRLALLGAGVPEAELGSIEAAVAVSIDDATEVAKASPPPDEALVMTEVWSDGGASWRN
jgi:TPP-dependent pyruvate/acetoin dehydrogenase alpha subunit